MPLAPGTRFGAHEIIEAIGAGGMGEVYRATDTNLKRDVAIKVLPESFAADADRLARFQREAEVLAALNHPNVAQIYGLEKADGVTAIVLELVDGPTLADRIAEGPIPADEALHIARQIADALEAAHAQGIVHRDLKPANVKFRADGTVKVLDFGIAKAFETQTPLSGPQVPSLTTPAMTQAGILLGTAAYMSPEQARGKPVDARTDIWAFGCVLYEMLTGQPAFGGEDVPLTLARVLAHDTDMNSVPGTISLAVRHTIAMCLEKNPAQRIADIRDVKLALAGAFETVSGAAQTAAVIARPAWRRALPVAAAFVAGALLIGIGVFGLRPAPAPEPVHTFAFELPEGQAFRNQGRSVLAVSPDGQSFAYNTTQGLYIRPLGELTARLIPGTEESLANPFFSPDGQSIAYFAGGALKRIAISGGAPVVIASGLENLFGGSWASDGTIFIGQTDGIYRVPATGGTPEPVIPAEEGELLYGPELLPDGDSVLFSANKATSWDTAQVVVQSLGTGERTVLVNGGSDAHYLPDGRLVYALGDALLGIAFDARHLSVSGGPTPLAQRLARAVANLTAAANYGVTADGTLIYLAGSTITGALPTLTWVDRQGHEEPTGFEPCTCADLALSPDGTRVAATEVSAESGLIGIWIWSLESGTHTRLTFEGGNLGIPVWSRDGDHIAYGSPEGGLFWRAADGTGSVEQLSTEGGMPGTMSADGLLLTGEAEDNAAGPGIGALSVADDHTIKTVLETESSESFPALSPDGSWLAYESDETGRPEIYVRPYPDVDSGKWQVSASGGRLPHWAGDGEALALYFLGPTDLMEAKVETSPSFRRQTPRALFNIDGYSADGFRIFDVAADGQRFLMLKTGFGAGESEHSRFVVVEHWTDEVKRLVPTD